MPSSRSHDARFVLIVWAVSRAWLALCAYAGHRMHPFLSPVRGGYSGVSNWWLNVWTTYDSTYFIEIAQRGYRPLTTAFFPLYPLLLRPFGPDENSIALAGVVISNLAFLGALWVLLSYTTARMDAVVARRAVLVLAFFPSAVFSMAVYTDALFLLLALLALSTAHVGRWRTTAVLGALAALTRNAGPVLAVALWVEWWLQRRQQTSRAPLRAAVLLSAPLLCFIAMQLYFSGRFGRVTLLEAQAAFGRAPSFPWQPLINDLLEVVHGGFTLVSALTLLNVAVSCLVFVFAWYGRKRLPWPDLALMCGVMLMQLCYARTWPPFTVSSLRYVLSTPAFSKGIAMWMPARESRVLRLTVATGGILLCGGVAFLFGMKAFIA